MILALKVGIILGSIYSGGSLFWLMSIYCLLLAGDNLYFPFITACVGLPNLLFLLLVKMEIRDELFLKEEFNWAGMFSLSPTIKRVTRTLIKVSMVNFLMSLVVAFFVVRVSEWNKSSPDGERVIFAVYVSMHIMIALTVFLYGLYGKSAVLSQKAIAFYLSPIKALSACLTKKQK